MVVIWIQRTIFAELLADAYLMRAANDNALVWPLIPFPNNWAE